MLWGGMAGPHLSLLSHCNYKIAMTIICHTDIAVWKQCAVWGGGYMALDFEGHNCGLQFHYGAFGCHWTGTGGLHSDMQSTWPADTPAPGREAQFLRH